MFQTISICQGNLQEWLLSDARARNVILDGLSGNYFSPLLEILNGSAMKKLWRVPF